jgi:precorrin-6B methylase 2
LILKMNNRRMYLMIWVVLASFSLSAQDQWKNVYTKSAWTDRDKWQKSGELIRQLNLKPGSQVADIGCHEGYITFKLSTVVGEKGLVYAVDVEQHKLDMLKFNQEQSNAKNIIAVKGDYDDPKLPLNSLDAVIIVDTYHEMDDHETILQHVMNALKSGGRLVLCEPIADERKKLLRADQERKHELGMNYALEDLKNAGFTILKKQDPFVDRAEKGDKMWLVVAVKK